MEDTVRNHLRLWLPTARRTRHHSLWRSLQREHIIVLSFQSHFLYHVVASFIPDVQRHLWQMRRQLAERSQTRLRLFRRRNAVPGMSFQYDHLTTLTALCCGYYKVLVPRASISKHKYTLFMLPGRPCYSLISEYPLYYAIVHFLLSCCVLLSRYVVLLPVFLLTERCAQSTEARRGHGNHISQAHRGDCQAAGQRLRPGNAPHG